MARWPARKDLTVSEPPAAPARRYLGRRAAIARLGVGAHTFRRAVWRGDLVPARVGGNGRMLFDPDALDAYAARRTALGPVPASSAYRAGRSRAPGGLVLAPQHGRDQAP